MLAIVYNKQWDIAQKNMPRPLLENENDVVIEIKCTGICGTDLSIISGDYPLNNSVIIGHESAGVVCEVGSKVEDFKVGDRVVIDPTFFCNECEHCLNAQPNHCIHKATTEAGISKNGTLAQYYLTNEKFIYKINDTTSFYKATLTEPIACILNALNKVDLSPKKKIAIIGGGPIGLLILKMLYAKNIYYGTLFEISLGRLEVINSKATLIKGEWDLKNNIFDNRYKNYFDLIIDTSGLQLQNLCEQVRPGGTILLISLKNTPQIFNPQVLVEKSISIVGSVDSNSTFSNAVDIINDNDVVLDDIITHIEPFDCFVHSLERLGINYALKKRTNNITSLKTIINMP